jgi:hypothetical protein
MDCGELGQMMLLISVEILCITAIRTFKIWSRDCVLQYSVCGLEFQERV